MTHLVNRLAAITTVLLLNSCQSPQVTPQPATTLQGAPIDSAQEKVPPSGLREAPTDPQARAKLAVEAPQPHERDGYTSVSFSDLASFPYNTDEDGKLLEGSSLPQKVELLDQEQVALSGFLVPIEFKGEKVSSLILVRNQLLCCFGEEPKLNEWVFINIDPPVEMIVDVPVTLFGKFSASPDEEDDQIISLYRMEATAMEKMDP